MICVLSLDSAAQTNDRALTSGRQDGRNTFHVIFQKYHTLHIPSFYIFAEQPLVSALGAVNVRVLNDSGTGTPLRGEEGPHDPAEVR